MVAKGEAKFGKHRALCQRVDEWMKSIEKLSPEPFVTDIKKADSKWFSRRYCLEKLGM